MIKQQGNNLIWLLGAAVAPFSNYGLYDLFQSAPLEGTKTPRARKKFLTQTCLKTISSCASVCLKCLLSYIGGKKERRDVEYVCV